MFPSFKLLTSFIFSVALLCGCDSTVTPTDDVALNNDIFKYKGAYVGDNSAVGNTLYYLDATSGKDIANNGFQLITDNPPYGIVVDYEWAASEQAYKETLAYHATYFFVLLRNADFVTFNFAEQSYTLTKDALITWYGQDFTNIADEQALKVFIRQHFDSERIDELAIS